jgi:hypothetical protein
MAYDPLAFEKRSGGMAYTKNSGRTRGTSLYDLQDSKTQRYLQSVAPSGANMSTATTPWVMNQLKSRSSAPSSARTSTSRSSGSSRSGRSYGGGGGGSGGGTAGMSQDAFNSLLQMLASTAPDKLKFERLGFTPYEGTGFYDFDSSRFDQARNRLRGGVAEDVASGNRAYDDAAAEMARTLANNPYESADWARSGGDIPDVMQSIIAAQGGAGRNVANATQGEAVQADDAFANVLAMLGASQQARNQSTQRALGGDRRRFNEGMRSQRANLEASLDQQLAAARAAYDRERWQYGENIARQNYEARTANAQANWQAKTQIENQNVTNQNQWKQQTATEGANLAAANPGLSFDALIKLIAGG